MFSYLQYEKRVCEFFFWRKSWKICELQLLKQEYDVCFSGLSSLINLKSLHSPNIFLILIYFRRSSWKSLTLAIWAHLSYCLFKPPPNIQEPVIVEASHHCCHVTKSHFSFWNVSLAHLSTLALLWCHNCADYIFLSLNSRLTFEQAVQRSP